MLAASIIDRRLAVDEMPPRVREDEMLSDQEIIDHIDNSSYEASVKWIIQLVNHEQAYLSILLRLLRETDQGLLRIKIPMALGELGIASDAVLGTLIELAKNSYAVYTGVRDAAQKALAKLASQNIKAISSHLESECDWWGAEICAEALAMTQDRQAIPVLVHALQKFPDNSACLKSLLSLAGEQSPYYVLEADRGIEPTDRGQLARNLLRSHRDGNLLASKALRYLWWHLSVDEQQSIEAYLTGRWFHDGPFHPAFDNFFHERFRDLMRRSGLDEEALARLRQATGFQPLRAFFNLTSITDLTSLRVDQAVTYEDCNLLRFAALVERATTREGESIERLIEGLTDRRSETQRLLEQEREYDQLREELVLLRQRLNDLLALEATFLEVLEPDEVRNWSAEIDHIAEQIKLLQRRISNQGEGPLPMLRRATERLLPALREHGVSFKQLDIEGVLGEYNFVEHKITLYPAMIELAARDLALGALPGWTVEEITGLLSAIVDIHETAHANLHLGRDADGQRWDNLTSCSVSLHEGLAQCYTHALIKQTGDKQLLQIFTSLSKKQPEAYGLWSLLEPCSHERLRYFVLAQRNGERWPTVFDVTAEAMQLLAGNRNWIKSRLGEGGWQAFTARLNVIESKLQGVQSRSRLAAACNELLELCDAFAATKLLLRSIFGGFPSEEDRRLLQMAAICQRPPEANAYKRTRLLAINLQTAMMEAPLSPEERGIANTIIEAAQIVRMTTPIEQKPTKRKQKGSQSNK
ncbi:MAG: hypothetical protein V7641_951 [Blastocatellia bacterium]